MLALSVSGQPGQAVLGTLTAGVRVEHQISAGEVQHWSLSLKRGTYLEACAEFHQINLSMALESYAEGEGSSLAQKAPTQGPRTCIRHIVDRSGRYSIHFSAPATGVPRGTYSLMLDARAAIDSDRQRVKIEVLMRDAATSSTRFTSTSLGLALQGYERALTIAEQIGDRDPESCIALRIAEIYSWLGDWPKAEDFARKALDKMDAGAYTSGRLYARYVLARADVRLQDAVAASKSLTSLLDSARMAQERSIEALTVFTLGQLYMDTEPAERDHYFQLAAEIAESSRDANLQHVVEVNIGDAYFAVKHWSGAITHYDRALHNERTLAVVVQASVTARLATALLQDGQTERAEKAIAEADRLGRHEQKEMLAILHRDAGNAYSTLGFAKDAMAHFYSCLRYGGSNRAMKIEALAGIADAATTLGDYEHALKASVEALSVASASAEVRVQAQMLLKVAEAFGLIGDHRQAITSSETAIDLLRKDDDPLGLAEALHDLGENLLWFEDSTLSTGLAVVRQKNRARALQAFEEALRLRRQNRDEPGVVDTLLHLGELYSQMGQNDKAIELFKESAGLSSSLRDDAARAEALEGLANAYVASGDIPAALPIHDEALNLRRGLPDRHGQASSMASIAIALSAAKRLDESLHYAQQSIDILENLRETVHDTELRVRAFAGWTYIYDLCVSINLELHRQYPNKRFDVTALEWHQRSLARSLLDSANAARRASSRQTTPLPSISSIQHDLDSGTVVLDYALGSTNAMWAITREKISLFELPDSGTIQSSISQCYSSLRLVKSARPCPAQTLADELLKPARSVIANKRVVISGDPELALVPFALLPDPAYQTGQLFAQDHEIVYVPSVAYAIARIHAGSPTTFASETIAVFVNPVICQNDIRLPHPSSSEGCAFGRISSSEITLKALKAAGGTRIEAFTDFRANRRMALGVMNEHPIVHFTTHAVFDFHQGSTAGLVLSTFDEKGVPIRGLITTNDIYPLRLNSELIFLSGCGTSQGEIVPGEGALSVSRALLFAGARRVIATLWPVEDAVNAIFTATFYNELLKRHQSPSAALRKAQLRLAEIWPHDPHLWAGYILQGDWK